MQDVELSTGMQALNDAVDGIVDPDNLSHGGKLRRASARLISVVLDLTEGLWCLAALSPAGSQEACALRRALVNLSCIALDLAAGEALPSDLATGREATVVALDTLLAERATQRSFPTDECEAAFGIAYERVLDSDGIFSGSRLLSAYYGRYQELETRLNAVLSPVTDHPPDILNALQPAEALVISSRSLLTLRTAIRVRNLLSRQFASHPGRLVAPLLELKLNVDRSAASHSALIRTMRQLSAAETDAQRAELTLDIYRRLIEGQFRPWAWALLRIRGHSSARMPEVSALRDQLVAEGDVLMVDAARAILPTARNASAHEDYVWDEGLGRIRVGKSTVSVEELTEAADRAYAFMLGAECAWRCCRSAIPALAARLDAADPPGGLKAINERIAVAHFGTNGLAVRRWTHEKRCLTVVLDQLPLQSVDPCFQAAMWASRHLDDVDRVVVRVGDIAAAAMDLPRNSLDATFAVWKEARGRFAVMPGSTFLPVNAAARLTVEDPAKAGQALAWLALNDVVHAYIDAEEDPTRTLDWLARLAARLQIAVTSLATTALTVPDAALSPLHDALDLLAPAASWAASAACGGSPGPSRGLQVSIEQLYERLPVAALLPTVDPRPLG